MSENPELNLEQSFSRLEEILERMNSGTVSLDDSLKLYEEADRLIALCGKKLKTAEMRIEMLIKKKRGNLELNSTGEPQVEVFQEASHCA